jgi:hypothetical protein
VPDPATSRAKRGRTGGEVAFELPDHEPTRLPPTDAAALMVEAYGEGARDQEIAGGRGAFETYWEEVERLLAEREATD